MALTHLEGASRPLHVQQPGPQVVQPLDPGGPAALQIVPVQALEQQIQALAVPPALHVRLAQPERELVEDHGEAALVVNLDVPGMLSVEPDLGLEQNLRYELRDAVVRCHCLGASCDSRGLQLIRNRPPSALTGPLHATR